MSSYPADRKYSQSHEWFLPADGIVTVGITQFAADELTDITFLDLPEEGSAIQAGQPFGEIESVKATSELVSSVAGEVAEVNTTLADAPEQVNNDPHGAGWMLKVRAADVSVLESLMDAKAYESMLASGA